MAQEQGQRSTTGNPNEGNMPPNTTHSNPKANPNHNVMELMEPNLTRVTEMNFGEFHYYILVNDKGGILTVDDDEICKYVAQPYAQWPPSFVNLMMSSGTNPGSPAHLPNIGDMTGLTDVQKLRRLLAAIVVELPGLPPLQSGFFDEVVDPMPRVDVDASPLDLLSDQVTLQIGSHTDVLMAFNIRAKMTGISLVIWRGMTEGREPLRFHKVNINPRMEEESPFLPQDEKFVVWNARGVARPSFKSNLEAIIQAYNPMFLVITESRISEPNFRRVFERLGIEMEWGYGSSMCDVLGCDNHVEEAKGQRGYHGHSTDRRDSYSSRDDAGIWWE